MDNEQGHEEEPQPRKIRVVDKRISSRRAAEPGEGEEAPPSPPPSSPSGPPEDASDASDEPEAAAEEPATVTPLRPPPAQSEHPSGGAAPGGGSAAAAEPPQPPGAAGPPGQEVWTPEQEEEARRMSEEMAQIPSLEWVINVAVTLANAAGTKLNAGHRDDAGLAIDALTAIVEKVGPRLGEAEAPLRQTLAQLQMAYAQMATKPGGPS
jgi:hypothetical protein